MFVPITSWLEEPQDVFAKLILCFEPCHGGERGEILSPGYCFVADGALLKKNFPTLLQSRLVFDRPSSRPSKGVRWIRRRSPKDACYDKGSIFLAILFFPARRGSLNLS